MADAEVPNAPAAEGEAPAVNKAAQRAATKKAKAAARAAKAEAPTQADPDDPLASRYGDSELIQSRSITGRVWTDVGSLGGDSVGKSVLVRARVHAVRGTGKNCFLVLRQGWATVQAVVFADGVAASKPMVKYAQRLPKESLVDVEGTVVAPKEAVVSCSQSDVEIQVNGVHCVSRAAELPFQVTDASRSEEEVRKAAEAGEQFATVLQDNRLNHRYLDLRTPANQGIFRLQSAVCQLFREILLAKGFCEIHTPKLIGGASEGGAAVFRLQYMGQPACLAQSPQLYKQMAICSDLGRVFEIGPVFRAETSNTHRHLCEFTGLDFEMAIHEHYSEVLDVVEDLFMNMFEGLRARFSRELAAVASQFPFEPFEAKPVRLLFSEGIKMLQAAGHDVDPLGDLSTETEKALGALVKEEYATDFYILHRYPAAVRPFYTMPAADDPNYSNSFDVFMRGEEIISGAQRVHDAALLVERARACEVPVETIQAYVDSFKLGAPPHGGVGVGLERVVMLYCGLNNIRKTSMFPRDPKRLSP
ncbi:unnamed protein product [Ostreobium quekettii]|uniref:aspartate--tRNA ligase n=1 Tax=Ostreobium quekettii TaxID=121088 RepID=A0A8S1IZI6_9CHLO|nr:unnamed protein product [Ostreobium quekettii]|eukprot:evm.model.scf_350.3 EVM.evm.TU.scf_350.3   scf_350:61649-64029(+)